MTWLKKFKAYPKALRKCFAVGFLFGGILLATLLFILAIMLLVVIGTPLALLGNQLGFRGWLFYDCLWNALLGGTIKETISSRLGKSIYAGHAEVFGNFERDFFISLLLHQLDPDHVRQSIQPNVGVLISDSLHAEIMARELDQLFSPV